MYRAFACGLYVTCVFFCDKKEEEEEFLILGVRIRQYVGIAHWALANACLMLQRIQSTGKQLYQQKVLLTFITFTYSYTIIIIIIMFLNDNRLRQVHCHWLYHPHQLIKNVQPDICKQVWYAVTTITTISIITTSVIIIVKACRPLIASNCDAAITSQLWAATLHMSAFWH